MTRALRYLTALLVDTVSGTAELVLAMLRREPSMPGGTYDRVPREWSRRLLAVTGIDVRTTGLDHVSGLGPCVYVVNHLSFVDVWVLLVALPGSLRFVGKRELFRIPIFGTALRVSGQIPIDRQDRRSAVASFDTAGRLLRAGHSAVVFPEGTRSRDGSLQPFKKGAFVLAIATQHPVVPVVVAGTFGLMPRGGIVPRAGRVEVRIGAPIATAGLSYDDRDALVARAHSAMGDLLDSVDGVLTAG
ncbi:MAG TPA: lysophospholipid acyltransferase family protein [Gemmatimonadales bacterium]|nr:lysophospholipid acyltransferase family protein [Gemmatimonadales bacterium]